MQGQRALAARSNRRTPQKPSAAGCASAGRVARLASAPPGRWGCPSGNTGNAAPFRMAWHTPPRLPPGCQAMPGAAVALDSAVARVGRAPPAPTPID
jgi:hypothetical protein